MFLIDEVFDWHSIFLGKEHWSFLPQVIFKTIFMFIVVLLALRLIGRRGIMQGVFQVLTIIMLGSSAGDPMLYREVGLLPATLVFIMIVLLYRLVDFLVAKYTRLEHKVEGSAIRLIKNNRFTVENFERYELSKDEIFADLRMEGITHLGQVKTAYMEAGGEISVFYCRDEEVQFGLPILPEADEESVTEIKKEGIYSCRFCGNTLQLLPIKEKECSVCQKKEWIRSINEKRVS